MIGSLIAAALSAVRHVTSRVRRSVALSGRSDGGDATANAYEARSGAVKLVRRRHAGAVLAAATVLAAIAQAAPARAEITLVALGDSLTAGFGLAPKDAFPARLEARLRDAGHDVTVVNAGVSGDTSAAGLARLDWAVPEDADGVIVELGGNDALRGIEPKRTAENLDRLLASLAEKRVPVLLAGMLAPRNLGPEYASAFDPIFKSLAERHGAVYYPFFLDGVATDPALNQDDGIHPNEAGVAAIVERMLPAVEKLMARIAAGNSTGG